MKPSCIALTILVVLGLAGSGCKSESKPPDPAQSSIVQQVEAAGVTARDLSQAQDIGVIQLWLIKHPDVAKNIAGPCKAAMKSDLTWQNSEEGKICLAESSVPKSLLQ